MHIRLLLTFISLVLMLDSRNAQSPVKPDQKVYFLKDSLSIKVNWTIPNDTSKGFRYLLAYSTNNSLNFDYYIESSVKDYNDPLGNSFSAKDINECHLDCMENFSCVGYSFNPATKICNLKFNNTLLVDCNPNLKCFSVLEYKNFVNFDDFTVNSKYTFMVKLFSSSFATAYSDIDDVDTSVSFQIIKFGDFNEYLTSILECSTSDVLVRLNYTWYKDNAPVDLKRLNATTFENKLNFSYLDHFIDDGNYSCEVNIPKLNQKVFVGYVPVQIKHKPLLRITPSQSTLRYNESNYLNMTCIVDSFPVKDSYWNVSNILSNNIILRDDMSNSLTIESLFISSLKRSDNGTYYCCTNDTSTACLSVNVIVQSKPSKPIIVNATYSGKTEETVIKWVLEDDGDLEVRQIYIEWIENNITNFTTVNITFRQDKTEYEGVSLFTKDSDIRIRFRNILGYSDYSDTIKVVDVTPKELPEPNIPTGTIIPVVICLLLSSCFVILYLRRFEKKREKMRIEMDKLDLEVRNRSYSKTSNDSYNKINVISHHSINIDENNEDEEQDQEQDQERDQESEDMSKITVVHSNPQHEKTNYHAIRRESSFGLRNEATRNRIDTNIRNFSSFDTRIRSSSDNKENNKEANIRRNFSEHKLHNIHEKSHENQTHEPIDRSHTLKELYENWNNAIKLKHLDKDFQEEHDSIKNPDYLKCNDALQEYNLSKSKYNMFPYDFNRVKLNMIADVEGSDFINASYIEGHSKNKKFIAAQSPDKNTINDFLRMIFEKNIKCMVMLCKLREDFPTKTKCFPFWNDLEEVKIGDYSIKATIVENKCTYLKRILTISNPIAEQVTEVNHYQYTEWPDKENPDESESVYSIIEKVNAEEKHYPILVFCNNGNGRTGTYIALDILIETLQHKEQINIRQLLTSLRMQRANTVETWHQYKFIHYALLQRYIFGKTEIPMDSIDLRMNKLNRFDRTENKIRMEIEYHKLAIFRDTEKTTDVYADFPKKFRSESFIPYDDKLVIMDHTNTENPSDKYIDAVVFEPSQIDIKFIIASDPSNSTLKSFLDLIFFKKPTLIVSLSNQIYLPNTNECIKFAEYKLTNTQTNMENDIKVHTLELLKIEDNKKVTFQYFDPIGDWTEEHEPENKELFIKYINTILNISELKYMETRTPTKLLIHSEDGGDQCAIFVASCVLLNSIDVKESFDVPKIVRQLRRSKKKLISKFELYKFLYEICYHYVKLKDNEQTLSKDKAKNGSNDSLIKIDEEIKNASLIG